MDIARFARRKQTSDPPVSSASSLATPPPTSLSKLFGTDKNHLGKQLTPTTTKIMTVTARRRTIAKQNRKTGRGGVAVTDSAYCKFALCSVRKLSLLDPGCFACQLSETTFALAWVTGEPQHIFHSRQSWADQGFSKSSVLILIWDAGASA